MKPMTEGEAEMWKVARLLRPDITRAQFRLDWAAFAKLRREHERRADPASDEPK